MFSMFLSDIFSAKIVDKMGDRYWLTVVFTLAGGEAYLPIPPL